MITRSATTETRRILPSKSGPYIAYGGARGGGKSWAMRRKFVLLALRYPKLKILLFRRTMPDLRNNIRPLQAELDGFALFLFN